MIIKVKIFSPLYIRKSILYSNKDEQPSWKIHYPQDTLNISANMFMLMITLMHMILVLYLRILRLIVHSNFPQVSS